MPPSSKRVFALAIRSFVIVVVAIAFTLASLSPSVADEPKQPDVKSPKLKDLLKERLAAAQELAKLEKTRFQNREGTIDELLEATRMVFDAQLDLCDSDKDRIAVLEKFVTEAKEIERLASQLVRAGQARTSTELKARMERLQAEIALERTKAKTEAKPK